MKYALTWMSLYLTDDKSTLVQVMALYHQATSHHLSQCWPRSVSLYSVTRPQWVNASSGTSPLVRLLYFGDVHSLWPSNTICQYTSGSTMAQVMACCLMAPSHYLTQCWLIIAKVQWHSSEDNFTRDAFAINPIIILKNNYLKFHLNLEGD